MAANVSLRPGVVFRPDPGTIECAGGRTYKQVSYAGDVIGSAGGEPARVRVLLASYPVSDEQIAARLQLPVLAAVAVETNYLQTDRDVLFSLFALGSAVEWEAGHDPVRTMVLTMHGSADVDEQGQMRGGAPCLPALGSDRIITLEPPAVAAMVGSIRGPQGERPTSLVNLGCFSSTPRGGSGPSFNEELAGLLAGETTVYGPPLAGVVTAAMFYGAWRNQFRQERPEGESVRDVPIRFRRIAPPVRPSPGPRTARSLLEASVAGTVVITNDCELAMEMSAYSPDFAGRTTHQFDRGLLE